MIWSDILSQNGCKITDVGFAKKTLLRVLYGMPLCGDGQEIVLSPYSWTWSTRDENFLTHSVGSEAHFRTWLVGEGEPSRSCTFRTSNFTPNFPPCFSSPSPRLPRPLLTPPTAEDQLVHFRAEKKPWNWNGVFSSTSNFALCDGLSGLYFLERKVFVF